MASARLSLDYVRKMDADYQIRVTKIKIPDSLHRSVCPMAAEERDKTQKKTLFIRLNQFVERGKKVNKFSITG